MRFPSGLQVTEKKRHLGGSGSSPVNKTDPRLLRARRRGGKKNTKHTREKNKSQRQPTSVFRSSTHSGRDRNNEPAKNRLHRVYREMDTPKHGPTPISDNAEKGAVRMTTNRNTAGCRSTVINTLLTPLVSSLTRPKLDLPVSRPSAQPSYSAAVASQRPNHDTLDCPRCRSTKTREHQKPTETER
nr:hypothetical protein [Pandoravirus massiliensis]